MSNLDGVTTDQIREWVESIKPHKLDIDSFFVPQPTSDGSNVYTAADKFRYLLQTDATPDQWRLALVSLDARLNTVERVIASSMRAMYRTHDTLCNLLLIALDAADQDEREQLLKEAEEAMSQGKES